MTRTYLQYLIDVQADRDWALATAPWHVVPHDTKFALGLAVSVTDVPEAKGAPQVWAGQSIPAGELVMLSPVLLVAWGTTVRMGAELPPGQEEISGSFTVTVAPPLTRLPLGPVPLS